MFEQLGYLVQVAGVLAALGLFGLLIFTTGLYWYNAIFTPDKRRR